MSLGEVWPVMVFTVIVALAVYDMSREAKRTNRRIDSHWEPPRPSWMQRCKMWADRGNRN